MSFKKKFVKPVQHQIEYWLVRLLFASFSLLSFRTLSRIGDIMGSLTYHVFRVRRRVTLDNLSHAFPDKSPAERHDIARRTYRNFGRTFIQFLGSYGMSKADIRQVIRFGDLEKLQKIKAKGRGAIIVASHFGNWELLNIAFGAYDLLPACSIVRLQKNRKVDRLIRDIRGQTGIKSIPLGISIREILKALRNNEFVGIAGDQNFKKDGSVWVQFFGRPVLTAQGTAAFALKTGAPLVCGFTYHQPDGRLTAAFEMLELPELSGDTREDIQRITQHITNRLEQEIRAYPDHWFWMHRRWKHSHKYPG